MGDAEDERLKESRRLDGITEETGVDLPRLILGQATFPEVR